LKIALIVVCVIVVLAILLKLSHRNPNFTGVEPSDEEMNAAIDKARAAVAQFLKVLQSPKASQVDFTVKKAFQCKDDEEHEHLWLHNVTFDGTIIHGEVANDPRFVDGISFGDSAEVLPGEISDWKYIEDGKLVGGYTIRVLLDKMPEGQKAAFLDSLPFEVD